MKQSATWSSVTFVVLATSTAWLMSLPLLTPAHEDTARNLLMARDCLDDVSCVLAGPMSSFSGFLQGAVSILGLSLILATIPGHAMAALTGCFALATALIFVATWRSFTLQTAILTAALWLMSGVAAAMFPVLDVPLFLPLGVAITLFGALRMTSPSSSVSARLILTLGVAITVNTHLAGLLFIPGVLTLIVLRARRPWLEGFIFMGLLATITALLSADALLYNMRVAPPLVLWVTLPGAVLWIGLSAAFRARLQPTNPLKLVVWLAVCHLTLMVALSLALDVTLSWRLAAAALPFISVALADVFTRLTRHMLVTLALAGGLLFTFHTHAEDLLDAQLSPVDIHTWSLGDVNTAADALRQEGLDHLDRLAHLQGPRMPVLLPALAAYDTTRSCELNTEQPDWLLVRTTEARLPALLGENVQLIATQDEGILVLRPIQSWLNRRRLEACLTVNDVRDCAEVKLSMPNAAQCQSTPWLARAYPQLEGLDALVPARGLATEPSVLSYTIEVLPAGADQVRTIQIASPRIGDCSWRFTGASDLYMTQSGDGSSVTIRPTGRRDARGQLHLEKVYGGGCPDVFDRFLPSLVETRPGETSLYSLVWSATPDG